MIRNYLKIAIRNLWKQKGYTAINLIGMTVGLLCCFLILIFITHERNYDTFHQDPESLYRLNYQANFSGSTFELTRVPAPICPLLKENFPQVQEAARLFPRSISARNAENDKMFEIEQTMFADSTLSQIFDLEFVAGNEESVLTKPYTLILTEETATQLFGDQPAVGQSVFLAGQKKPFTVTAVVRDFPEQAHLHFDMLAPWDNIVDVEPDYARESILSAQTANWLASYTYTYVRLKPGSAPKDMDAAFPAFLKKFGLPQFVDKQAFVLASVPDIHLHSIAQGEPESVANHTYLKSFAIVGLLILLIACINFINLSNAIYLERMKEVAVRKVLGAGKKGLIVQLVLESMLICGIAFFIALIGVQALLPYMDVLTDRVLAFNPILDWQLTGSFVLVLLLAGLLAGLYPALIASKFQPVQIFQKHTGHTGGRQWLRKSLITVQFIVGIALLSGTIIILAQLDYWKNRPLGFQQEHIIAVPLFSPNMNASFMPGDSSLRGRTNAFEEQLLQNPSIEAVTLGSSTPGVGTVRNLITTDKVQVEDNVFLPCISADYDFAQTYDLNIVAGRDFGKEYGQDHINAFMVNEKAVKTLGWESPEDAIGKKIGKGGKEGIVVGVVNDFHTSSLQADLEPVILDINVGQFTTFSIRIQNSKIPETLTSVEQTWKRYFPEKAFDYTFLDERLQLGYNDERQLARLIGYFAGLAIFLSCFGLFGLISFTIHQKSKEIGIRKVLGATVPGLVTMLAKGYLLLVLIAFAIATPLTWYYMQVWLENFTYHIDVPVWVFAVSGVLALLVAFLTVSMQSTKAALANPVTSLRSE